jgi:hypothetical protein
MAVSGQEEKKKVSKDIMGGLQDSSNIVYGVSYVADIQSNNSDMQDNNDEYEDNDYYDDDY